MDFRVIILMFFFLLAATISIASDSTRTIDSLRISLADAESDLQKYEILTVLIDEYNKENKSKAIDVLYDRLSIAERLNDEKKKISTYKELGQNYLFLNRNDSSLYFLELALPHYEKQRDTNSIADLWSNIALIHQRQNNLEEAVNFYQKILEVDLRNNNFFGAIATLINTASLHFEQDNPEPGFDYMKRAQHIAQETPKDSMKQRNDIRDYLAPALEINMGYGYERLALQNDTLTMYLDSALYHYQKAFPAIEKVDYAYNRTYNASYTNMNIGNIYNLKNDLETALPYYNKAQKGFLDIQNDQGLVSVETSIGDVLNKVGQYEKAEVMLLDALVLAKKINRDTEIRDAYEYLAYNAHKQGKYKEAYTFKEAFTRYNNNILNTDRINAVQKLETQFRTKEIRAQNKILEQDNQIKDQQKKQQQIIFLVSLLSILGLGFLGYSRYKLRKEREAAEYERTLNVAMARFVPTEFIESIGRSKITEVQLGDKIEKELTVVFTDIRNFTSRSENMTPLQAFNFVESYVELMGPIIQHNGGFINQYLGDGVMAIFQNSPENALFACIEMHAALENFNTDLINKGEAPVEIGMGLHTGPSVMGIIGDEDRLDAAMISDTVNTAARMEGKTKQFGVKILISEESRKRLKNPELYQLRHIGDVTVKGKSKPIDIYECFNCDDQEIVRQKMNFLDVFDEAVELYFNENYALALDKFVSIQQSIPNDEVSRSFIEECGKKLELAHIS